MTIFSAHDISKSFKDKNLFDSVSFGMEKGERIGIIGKNGIGKSTLMKIICGFDTADSGEVTFNNNATFEFLDQEPKLDGYSTVLENVLSSDKELYELLNKYYDLLAKNEQGQKIDFNELEELNVKIENRSGWNYESEAKKILSKLGIDNNDAIVSELSGGFKKRVALAKALLSKPDLLILDEPTNHLDADSVQWLQDKLQKTNQSLLFVTHDRYFLDALSTRIVEIDHKKIFTYPGNYEKYLEQKEAFERAQSSELTHKLSRLRTELAWLQRGARARRSKQQSRVDWIDELKKSTLKKKENKIKIELGNTFLGSRIIDAVDISYAINGKVLFKNYTYLAKPKDRIGIIGVNGSGKSTLLNVLAGRKMPNEGKVLIGGSANIGFFEQENEALKDTQTVIGSIREIADNINVGVGRDRYITASQLLEKFLFPRIQHKKYIETLSGGEKRRLALVRMLMTNPNVIFLDEPTNDFDIATLKALEEYLDDFYGVLLIVSHDRAFLDRTVDFIHAFENDGNIKEYPGNYSRYLELKETKKNKKEIIESPKSTSKTIQKTKLSYMEQREYDGLETKIEELEQHKEELGIQLTSIDFADYEKINKLSISIKELEDKIEQCMERWIYLSDLIKK